MSITALPGGTWAQYEKNSWNENNSDFVIKAKNKGLSFAKQNFIWSTQLDGGIWASIRTKIFRGTTKHVTWNSSGMAFTWWAFKYSENAPINIITHSHGGNMALYAAKHGLKIKTLITVATPVRFDMRNITKQALPNIENWYHIYSDNDKWQLIGQIADGRFGFKRKMPIPKNKGKNIFVPGYHHSELLDPNVFFQVIRRNKLLKLLK